MAKKTEKIRLLLLAKDEDPKPRWRVRLYGNHCFIFTVLQFLFFFLFFVLLVVITWHVINIEQDITKRRPKISGINNDTIPGSEFCKSVNAENMSLVALGYLTAIREDKHPMEAKNQIYYITDRLLTDQEACAVEAALRLFQDKSIFIIEMGDIKYTNKTQTNYVKYLRQQYTNMNEIKTTPDKFFKGSPFETSFKGIDGLSIFAARILLVWQFGGTVVDPDFLLLSRRIFDNNEGFCDVDRDLLFCPNQCSAFVYQMVKTILDEAGRSKNETESDDLFQEIVDKSVLDYCEDQEAVGIGCIGINRIKEDQICTQLDPNCQYLRVQEWKAKTPKWKSIVQKFCPKIISKIETDNNEPFIK